MYYMILLVQIPLFFMPGLLFICVNNNTQNVFSLIHQSCSNSYLVTVIMLSFNDAVSERCWFCVSETVCGAVELPCKEMCFCYLAKHHRYKGESEIKRDTCPYNAIEFNNSTHYILPVAYWNLQQIRGGT